MVTGIILAGGKSKRMGKDKCLVKLGNKLLIQNTIDAFKPIVDTIIISSNREEHTQFGYKTFKDEFSDCGPIGGIYTALKNSQTEINIIAPCDMPFINYSLFKFLLENKKNFDAVIPVYKGKVEPLTGVYSNNILEIIKKQIKTGKFKILTLLESINTNFVEINSTLSFYSDKLFTNINYLEDLNNN
ncbi:MAG: molybdenum cofactor guanylyltransferase [Bacteroidales bacterium]|nr:molybdenum cofactor guanylyltransferase [Bacteroidales bacterium]